MRRNLDAMVEPVISAIVVLIAAVISIFLILAAVNVVLFLKLRSLIPQDPPGLDEEVGVGALR